MHRYNEGNYLSREEPLSEDKFESCVPDFNDIEPIRIFHEDSCFNQLNNNTVEITKPTKKARFGTCMDMMKEELPRIDEKLDNRIIHSDAYRVLPPRKLKQKLERLKEEIIFLKNSHESTLHKDKVDVAPATSKTTTTDATLSSDDFTFGVPQISKNIVTRALVTNKMDEQHEILSLLKQPLYDDETISICSNDKKLNLLHLAMSKSQSSQETLWKWDRKMGLRKCHSKTMRNTFRSRKRIRDAIYNGMGN